MIAARLQEWLDQLRNTSRQRWALGGTAVASAFASSAVIGLGSGDGLGWVVVFVATLAAIAAVQAGSHTALGVVAVIVLQWLGAVDDVSTPRSLAVALCLFVFHGVLALMAVTPHSATVDPAILRLWLQRSGSVAAGTVATWLVVLVFAQRDATGNAALTLGAVVALAAGALVVRARSIN